MIELGPKDGDRYAEHLERLDPEAKRFRFFKTPEDFLLALHAGAAVSDGRLVLACESQGVIRGVAELMPGAENPHCGELAFSVEREWRRRGLGCALMKALIAAAKEKEFTCVELEILPDNKPMRRLARRFTSDLRVRNGNVIAVVAL